MSGQDAAMMGRVQARPDEGYESAASDATYREALETLQGHIEIAQKVGDDLASIAKLFRLIWDLAGHGSHLDAEEFLADLIDERSAKLSNIEAEAHRTMDQLSATISGQEASR
jgi:hypothetical protein